MVLCTAIISGCKIFHKMMFKELTSNIHKNIPSRVSGFKKMQKVAQLSEISCVAIKYRQCKL